MPELPEIESISAPTRIQLRRTKGWRKPENTVVVSRPGYWGNPFRIGMGNTSEVSTSEQAVALFTKAHDEPQFRKEVREKLRGKNLACWCSIGTPCHADVLLKWANE